MLILERDHIWQPRVWSRLPNPYIHSLGDFPSFEQNTHTLSKENHPRCTITIVHKVQKDDSLHENICKYCTDRDPNIVFLMSPVGLDSD